MDCTPLRREKSVTLAANLTARAEGVLLNLCEAAVDRREGIDDIGQAHTLGAGSDRRLGQVVAERVLKLVAIEQRRRRALRRDATTILRPSKLRAQLAHEGADVPERLWCLRGA